MKVVGVLSSGTPFQFSWPSGDIEEYNSWIEYQAISEDGPHRAKVAFGVRPVYGQDRVRVLVLIDGYPHAEFFGADDYEASGDVLAEIRLRGEKGEPICRYPTDPIPERYTALTAVGLRTRVAAKRVHSAWAVVANVSDHRTMICLAGLRRMERARLGE